MAGVVRVPMVRKHKAVRRNAAGEYEPEDAGAAHRTCGNRYTG